MICMKNSMMQLTPIEKFDFNCKDSNLDNYSNNIPLVCLLKVDLDYSEELHNYHLSASEKIEVTKKCLNIIYES